MNFIMILIDSIATFVRRNPLLCLMVLMLALLAPSVLKGLAAFVFYFILGILLFGVIILMTIRWRFRRLQREMQEQFGGQGNFHNPGAGYTHRQDRQQPREEGEVKVYRTSETPEKRISEDVGDYVDFEETREKR
ncbi:MAG: DUF4834 family protein [Rikenellaceae bacterium]|nr:DUF4834 family protein [Rikenellaceae bacterium]